MYATKNILQIRKSQQDARLDRDLRNTAKNPIIETDIINSNDSNANEIEEDLEEEDRENLELSTANSYSHAVIITCKY